MGSCLSKKSTSCSSSSTTAAVSNTNQEITKINSTQVEIKKEVEGESVKKEIFVIKHRKSHEVDRKTEEEKGVVKKANEAVESANNNGELVKENNGIVVSAPVRTSSCTKEEVDAILIQCGRLSRSSSMGKTGQLGSSGSTDNPQRSRKYSGSKRSFDFESENGNEGSQENVVDCEDDGAVGDGVRRHRQRQRQPRTPNSSSQGRRRTPSRERDQEQQKQRSGSSRERGNSGGVRRVSRSPGRRSDSPITTSNGGNVASVNANGNNGGRPGKMVSVPATVSSMVMDKSIDAGGPENISAAAVKRVQVKRNAGGDGPRTAASPRARSPARVNAKVLNERDNNAHSNQNQQQPMSLSRSNSRKHEQSPYRRNPLSEIDTNVVLEQMPTPGRKVPSQKLNAETVSISKVVQQGTENKLGSSKGTLDGKVKEQNVAMNVIVSGPESHKPQRSRSLRLSRDLDINPEALSNPPQSYTALLLEDIQNFHQKTNTTTPAFSLPPCVTKACSILDAVADLNSTTSSNLSGAFSDDRRRNPTAEQFSQNDNASFGADHPGKRRLGIKDPFMESEVAVSDDLMEPSIQKYVTFRRGTDMEEQESSGSNSVVGQQNWLSPSAWEPNSADSTDCWPSSKSYSRDDNRSPLGFQRQEIGHDMEEGKRRVNVKRRDSDNQQAGIGRGRVGPRGGLHPISMAAST
ncbi:putative receptor-like protein kinase-like [Capsicum annuum]|uniref:uncharacterized protein At1g65710 n=1 Tax=Capsicum annuum TaxID=4072 RepID=UPI0007BF2DD8|nr:uncharacterized protein At1g65710 [Capsicum annuum]KAF3647971.1 putative receptor-like protein kinase-like [Capsicum annuum]